MYLKLIIAIIVIYLIYKLVTVWKANPGPAKKNLPKTGEDLVEDPYCHTYIPVSNARRASVEGETVYFCSQACLDKYIAEQKKT